MATLLILENDPCLYDVLLMLPEVWDLEGTGFRNAQAALEWIERVDKGTVSYSAPLIALLDIYSSSFCNGVDVSRRLRRSHKLSKSPIILITGDTLPSEDEALKASCGANAVIRKPAFHLGDIGGQIKTLSRLTEDMETLDVWAVEGGF
jgi:CheY-like chemotaxis protein